VLWAAVRVGILVVAVTALVRVVDWGKLTEVARVLSPVTILAIVACGTCSRGFGVVRWWTVLGGLTASGRPSVPGLFRLGLLAEFVNIWVPSFVGGEFVRIWGVRRTTDIAVATWSVGIDRVLGLIGLVLAVLPVGLLVDLPIPMWAWSAAVLTVVALLGIGFALRPWIARHSNLGAALATLYPPRVLGALALSVASPWCLVVGYLLFFGTLQPDLGAGSIAAFVLLSRFGRAVPVQLFGVNSVEGSMWLLGEILGIPREILAVSLAMNLTDKYLHSIAGGLLELAMNGTQMLERLFRGSTPG
jgi:hypothetical protein